MDKNKKSKTAPLPHRIMNKTSIYLAKQHKVERDDFLGYEAVAPVKGGEITIQSHTQITPQDGKIFEYILAQWFATSEGSQELGEIEVDVVEIINALGWQNRTENRKKVIQHLKNLIGVTIIFKWDGGEILFHLIEKVKILGNTKTIAVSVSKTYIESLKTAGKRYINVSNILQLKGRYDIELYKLLQMRGGGIDKDGQPKLVQKISLEDICQHLHLDKSKSSSKDIIARAFRDLRKNIEMPEYKYNRSLKRWEQTT